MSSIDAYLMSGEQWTDVSELHWIIFFWPLMLSIGLTIFIFKQHFMFALNYFALCLIVYFLLEVFIRYITTTYALSTQRVLLKRGWLFTRIWDIPLSRVESVQMEQSLFGKMLGYGTVVVNGIGGDSLVFMTIEDPQQFRQKIFTGMQAAKPTE